VNFFFSLVSNCYSFNHAGYAVGYDDTVVHGSLDDLKFAAFYTMYVWLLSETVGLVCFSDLNLQIQITKMQNVWP